jgi:uncharacterized protein (TIGR00251 family)
MTDIPATLKPDGIVLQVRLTPKSGTACIAGVEHYGEKAVVKAHVTAPAEDGKANEALVAVVANWLGVPRSRVSVVSGKKSRFKSVAVGGIPVELLKTLQTLLAALPRATKSK